MSHRSLASLCILATVVAVALLVPSTVAAQTAWTPPRTPDGQPDLQGFWTNSTLTPLERPADLAGKEFFTPEEAAAFEKRALEQGNSDRRNTNAELDITGSYNNFWRDRGTKIVPTRRTSLIVDPADGRIPALTPEAQKKVAERAEYRRQHPADGPEDLNLNVRCIVWPTSGPPMLPAGYNNYYQILQIPGYVIILVEMIHDVRIIPLDGRPHLPQNVHQWLGDSRGRWEGNTLVVETTNFTNKTNFRGSGERLHVMERFTRVDADTIRYQFTVNDPATFTRPWTAELYMARSAGAIYEYACHEGNYAMEGILAGARAEEKKSSK